ncbi:MAG: asparaginase [Actinomycetota bacterium]
MARRVLVLTTGGTISGYAGHRDTGVDGSEIDRALEPLRLHVLESDQIELHVGILRIDAQDSTELGPAAWTRLIGSIHEHYDSFDGFVVLHGTNTLGYTAAALAFGLVNNAKPVILTGAQLPLGLPASDAVANLHNAVRVAGLGPTETGDLAPLRGVAVVFGSHVIAGVRAKKSTVFDLDAFEPYGAGGLARIGTLVDINESELRAHHSFLSRPGADGYAEASNANDLLLAGKFDLTRVASLTLFPGMSPGVLTAMAESADDPPSVVILRAFGPGDIPSNLAPPLARLRERNVPVIATTQAARGKAHMASNGPGQRALVTGGVIPSHDMSIEAITVKAGWLVGRGVRHPEFAHEFGRSCRGEILPVPPRSHRWW